MNRKKVTLAQLQKSKRRVEKTLGGLSRLDAETVKRAIVQETIADVMEDVFNDIASRIAVEAASRGFSSRSRRAVAALESTPHASTKRRPRKRSQ